ncbi:ABC fe(3+) transporter permease [Paenibacillus sp. FSL R7-0273]|uniref:AraC family transcriptional regulator n=1 Tax=Paenibacillus sp. FSL R7-0273 TaxID=1536772 RepID=UPI0004F59F39|nr:AraC family transcriptional regulator [Paenibacillus sp. FSL R7-0273]AIQ47949.1 ABC fe(3+) transporter permease [Paenibacillus sp. FSL R7-0273]OMF94500.1 ABC fe(3+) transporter permease [Paenibacillus sp. FSL R7-0273]
MPLQDQASIWSDLAIKTLDVSSGVVPPGGVLSEKELTANLLLLAGGGQGRLVMNGGDCRIQAFFACHAVKGSAFTLTAGAESLYYTVITYKAVQMSEAAPVLFPPRNHPLYTSFVHPLEVPAGLHQTAEEMEAKWSRGEGLERFHVNALLQGMLYELMMEVERGRGGSGPDMVDIVTAYIAGHYRQELELKELAALAGCSTRQLQRRFKQEKRVGPMEYVIRLRMESAQRMLRHTDVPISEIAEGAGYRDMYYFSRAFKKYYGVPPQLYRRTAAVGAGALPAYTGLSDRFASSYGSLQGPVIRHMRGEYGVTAAPRRIAVLDVQYADHLLALDVVPAGSVGTGSSASLQFPQYIRDRLDATAMTGSYEYPDLEAVERLRPDLIICTEVHAPHYERLSRIAPALMFKRNESWQTILRLFGIMTDQQARAEAIIADYHRRTALLSGELATALGGQSVALIRPRESLVRVHTASHRTGAVLYRDLGLPAPLFVADTSDTAYHIPVDRLPAVHADHYFLLSSAQVQDEISATEQSTRVMLHAEEQPQIYAVDAATWIGCYGPTGINYIVDQVEGVLLA